MKRPPGGRTATRRDVRPRAQLRRVVLFENPAE